MPMFDVDQEGDYLAWKEAHPAGYVANISTQPRLDMVHKSGCRTLNRHDGKAETSYAKDCADDWKELSANSRRRGHSYQLCDICL